MPHVMVSYKREDEPRVAVLVRALRANGLEIWWDQALPGGESWRDNIQAGLDKAGAVVVVWSHGSTGPDGGFVRDEAGHAKARGILVPVRFDDVPPPLGFGELQAIDLRRWKGNPKDPFLLDVVAACRAKLEGKPAPPAKAPSVRLYRRLRAGALGALATGLFWSLATNLGGAQTMLCTIPVGQPVLSDACGAFGLGGRPSRDERIAWESLRKGSCDDLRGFVTRYPNGANRRLAADLLTAATSERSATWSPAPRTARGYVRQGVAGMASADAAQADARTRAQADAATLCAPIDANERLAGVDVTPGAYDCRPGIGGTVCALDYTANCRIETRPLVEHCGA
ncbi:MAG TPA: toll/interleukin-1 receptor domain-containing protein [Caulobacteraceae bacterium]|nr:toll/interleukin-1 receptor domain-containing protein [Caulobacteraceae bacterium]